MITKWFFIFVPLAVVLEHIAPLAHTWIFFTACLAIIPIAHLIVESTEHISVYTGDAIGGLLNATFGNAPELIIAMVALRAGLFDMRRKRRRAFSASRSIFPGKVRSRCATGKFHRGRKQLNHGMTGPRTKTFSSPARAIRTRAISMPTIIRSLPSTRLLRDRSPTGYSGASSACIASNRRVRRHARLLRCSKRISVR